MKHLLLTTIAAVVLVGCGESQPTVKAPDTSIHYAARFGKTEYLQQHLAAGTDVNAKDRQGWTPLHWAAWNGRKEIIELLIAAGADVNESRDMGRKKTPLDRAIQFKHTVAADLLRKHGGKTSEELKESAAVKESIHAASRYGNIEAVKQHLAAGTDVDTRDAEDKTSLQHAAYWGHQGIVELLIAKGADVNAKDNAGKTSLDWGRRGKKQTETADLLRKHGAKTGEELKAEGK